MSRYPEDIGSHLRQLVKIEPVYDEDEEYEKCKRLVDTSIKQMERAVISNDATSYALGYSRAPKDMLDKVITRLNDKRYRGLWYYPEQIGKTIRLCCKWQNDENIFKK